MTILFTLHQLGAFLVGAALGSFAALCVVRIPEDRSVLHPPSACPACDAQLAWHDNLPVVSWLLLGGRCRACGVPISPMYPLVELTCGAVAWLVYRRFVPTPGAMDLAAYAAFGVYTLFAVLLLIAAWTDLRARIIPELASLWAVPVGIAGAALLEAVGWFGWLDIGWRQAVLGALFTGGGLWAVAAAWKAVTGQVGLAHGDVRLGAMIGAFLGPMPGAFTTLLVASFLGAFLALGHLAVTGRRTYLPFGPSLALAAIAYVLWGDLLVRTWLPGLEGFL